MARALAITGHTWNESSFSILAYVEHEGDPATAEDIEAVHIDYYDGETLLREDDLVSDLQVFDELVTDDSRWCSEEYPGYNFLFQVPANIFTNPTSCGKVVLIFNPGVYQFKLVVHIQVKKP